MIVKKMEGPIYYKKNRAALTGKGASSANNEKSFDQYLLEAFEGNVVQNGDTFSPKISKLTQENLIRLSKM